MWDTQTEIHMMHDPCEDLIIFLRKFLDFEIIKVISFRFIKLKSHRIILENPKKVLNIQAASIIIHMLVPHENVKKWIVLIPQSQFLLISCIFSFSNKFIYFYTWSKFYIFLISFPFLSLFAFTSSLNLSFKYSFLIWIKNFCIYLRTFAWLFSQTVF